MDWKTVEMGHPGGGHRHEYAGGIMVSENNDKTNGGTNIVITLSGELLKEMRWMHEDRVVVKVAPDGSALRLERSKEGYTITRHGGKKRATSAGTIKLRKGRIPWLKVGGRFFVSRDAIEVDAVGFTALLRI
jgi:hypothetical protein